MYPLRDYCSCETRLFKICNVQVSSGTSYTVASQVNGAVVVVGASVESTGVHQLLPLVGGTCF